VAITKKTAISLPDDLFRQIERARRRSKLDRSTWIQQAASEYLKKRTKQEDIEAWENAYRRFPPTADERALSKWLEKTLPERMAGIDSPEIKPRRQRRAKRAR
jgi:metal-responsive CopG/Arc/MetJ family transcriptional regulator